MPPGERDAEVEALIEVSRFSWGTRNGKTAVPVLLGDRVFLLKLCSAYIMFEFQKSTKRTVVAVSWWLMVITGGFGVRQVCVCNYAKKMAYLLNPPHLDKCPLELPLHLT